MADAKIVLTPITAIIYARAFFLTKPHESPLMPGETRTYPFKSSRGYPSATAYRLDWYVDVATADARGDKLTDTARLPTAQFLPAVPGTDADPEDLQDGTVILTAPTTNGYENPIGIIEMVQDTGTTPPYIYLLDDAITMPTQLTEYRFRYKIGDPPATKFLLEWYATRLDADFQVDRLTETDRLPRAVFLPATPAPGDANTYQEGVLQLAPPVGTPYPSAVGLLCMVQDPIKRGKVCEAPIGTIETPRRHHRPTWETYRTP